jgi:signal peptide peptidase SppA
MNALTVLNAPWAILPEKLLAIQRVYTDRASDVMASMDAIEASWGVASNKQRVPYSVTDGVAIIALEGVIAKRMNMFTNFSGGTSSELVGRDIRAALADEAVRSIILAIDSPGGTVDGTQSLSDIVLAAREVKPIAAIASGTMASASYWIGSAAEAVYIEDATTITGSIGVVSSHVDVSQAEARQGLKTTEIYAGKYKRIASSHAPLTDAGRASMQEQVDTLYSIFVGDVARNRGVSVKSVLDGMADGRTFIGTQAIDAGLVDGVLTLSDLVKRMSQAAMQKTGG